MTSAARTRLEEALLLSYEELEALSPEQLNSLQLDGDSDEPMGGKCSEVKDNRISAAGELEGKSGMSTGSYNRIRHKQKDHILRVVPISWDMKSGEIKLLG